MQMHIIRMARGIIGVRKEQPGALELYARTRMTECCDYLALTSRASYNSNSTYI